MASNIDVQVIIDAVDKASGKLQGIGQKISGIGKDLAIVGAAPTAALGLATKAAIDFESAFAGVRKTVDASEAEFAQLQDNIRGIAKEAPVSTTELSNIGEMAGQLGVSGVDNLTKFIETISKISVTTNLTSEEAATSFARISNIMQEPIDNVDRMASVVVDLGNNFATTEAEITNFANRIAGAGAIAGLTTDEIFGIGAAFSSVGVEAEAGGTAVQKVLLAMNNAVITGNEDLSTFAETAGLTVDQFKDLSAVERFNNFVMGLGESGDEAIGTLEELGMTDQRLTRAFLSLANAGDLVIDSSEKAKTAWIENTAAVAEAEKRYATTESQLKIAKNQLADIGITIGSTLLPMLNAALKAVKPMVDGFAKFTEKHPKLVAGMLAVGAAVGIVGVAMVAIGSVISSTAAVIGALTTAFAALSTVAIPAVIVAAAPLLLTIGGIVAVVAALALAWKNNWFDIQGKTQMAAEAIRGAIDWLGQKFMEFIDFVLSIPQRWVEFHQMLIREAVITFVERIPLAIGFLAGRLVRFITEDIPIFIQRTIDWFEVLPGRILSAMQLLVGNIALGFQNARDAAIKKVQDMIVNVTVWFLNMKDQVSQTVNNLPQIISDAFQRAKENAINKVKEMVDGVLGWIGKIGDKIDGAINRAKELGNQAKTSFEVGYAGGQARAAGGPVSSATPVLVGEKGPEMFVPPTAGQIIPTKDLVGAGGNTSISITVNADIGQNMDIDKLVERLQWTISKQGLI